jgi:hypothetical protein
VEAQLDGVQQQLERGLRLELQEQRQLERQDELLEQQLELEQRRLAWPRWHRRNRRRL